MITRPNPSKELPSKRLHLPLVLVMALFPGTFVMAQSDASGEAEVVQEATVLEEVIVTATRRVTNVQLTAASITALSGKQLEEMGKVNVTDFISAVPGVTMAEGGWGKNRVIFRNVATSNLQAGIATSATYFDDFPVSTSDTVPEIRMVDMERVEVLKGPQGTLFGRSAMGGIVRYISNKPDTEEFFAGFNTYLSSTTDGGTNYGVQAFANMPITDNLAVRVAGYTFQHDGFIDNVELGIPDYNEEDTVGGRVALHWEATERLSVDLTYLNQSNKGAPFFTTPTRDPGDLDVAGDEGPTYPTDVDARTMISGVVNEENPSYEFLNLKLEYDFDSFTATFLATQAKYEADSLSDDREFVELRSGAIDLVNDNKTDSDTLELRLVSSTDGFLDWIGGLYYEDSSTKFIVTDIYHGPDQLLFGFFPLTDGIVAINQNGDGSGHEEAVYGEVGLNFTADTRLLLGYRYSDIEWGILYNEANGFFDYWQGFNEWVGIPFETQEDVSTYKLSLEHIFNEDIFGYALASSGYRRGGFNPASAISKFSTYDSDTLWNYEIGLKTTWLDGRLRANMAAYYIDWTDIQLVVQNPITFARETQNVGKAHIPGVEVSVDYIINDNWRLFAGLSYSDPQLDEDVPPSIDPYTGDLVYTGRKGDRLPGSAKETFSFGFNWDRPLDNGMSVFANGLYRYVGDRYNDFNLDLDVKLPAYSLTDLRLGINHPSGWSLALFADNVFDEAVMYSVFHAGSSFEFVPTNRPRTVGLNFIYNF